MEDLKKRVVRAGVSKLLGQGAIFVLRLGFVAIMARLLPPEDFGLVAMVIAFTGVYDLFTTAGLSLAAVQRPTITDEQVSTLFWVNILVGALLCLLCFVTAPFLVTFYNEPRLFWVTAALGAGFLFNAVGVQHSALLQRQLRFTDLTTIEVLSLLVQLCAWHRPGSLRFCILGSRRINDCHASDQQRLNVGLHGLDTRPAARSRRHPLVVEFWGHHYAQQSHCLCCLQR